MKNKCFSFKGIFGLIGAGVIMTIVVLCCGIFWLTRSLTAVTVCLTTAVVLSAWAFILIRILQARLNFFADDVCQTIDDMMQGKTAPGIIFDNDTLLDRINHRLNRLYQMLQNNQKKIEEQRTDLQGMISDISHQVKTPASNLKMAATLLLEQELPRTQQIDHLQSMIVQLDKLDFLMNTMVKSSRLETGAISLEKQRLPIYETLAMALGSIFLKAEEKHLHVTVDCPEDLIVPHDSKWTSEAVFNILENAVKYTLAGGTIRVGVVRWEAYTKIDIADTGRGIPESAQGAIFKRFYREPEVHNIEGIGIGLYLAREIISKQGGNIKVASVAGNGATFTVFLPNEEEAHS